jgi:YfiH family protein
MMINYNFFGKDCILDQDLKDRTDLNQKLNDLNFKFGEVLLLNQVHGDKVVAVDDIKKIHGTQNLPKADGIVTNLKNIAIGIVTADCAPIIFYDEEKQVIGACHAGWKGAKLGIIQETVKKMHDLGATNISAIIGPMIQQYSYQVSIDFYNEFLLESKDNLRFFKETADPIRWNFNLPNYVESKLSLSGVNDIENLMIDTYTNPQKYSSYRRSCHYSDEVRGRNVAVICLN